MADIIFACPFCKTPLMVEEELKGGLAMCYKCESTVMVPMPGVYSGMKLAGYTIEEQIGAGGMGEVWKASHSAMGRTVAIKILSPAMTTNPDSVAKFMKEVETTAKLDHPNIVTAFDAGVENGIYYLVTSFVDGETLKARLERENVIPEKEALNIALKISEALSYAWDAYKLIHSDINPGNIMITTNGAVKLTDMGISKSMAEDSSLTHSGMIIGTPHYMSPEQAKVEPDIDCRADIYSLGATLYHIMTGHVPFEASSAITVLAKHLTDELTPARKRNPKISKGTSHLISAMMAKNKRLRPLNWKVLISDIKKVIAGEMPSTNEPSIDGISQKKYLTQSEKEIIISRKITRSAPKSKLPPPTAKAINRKHDRKMPQRSGTYNMFREEKPSKAKAYYIVGIIVFLLALVLGGFILSSHSKNKKALELAREKEKALQIRLKNSEMMTKTNQEQPAPAKAKEEPETIKVPPPDKTLVFAGIKISSGASPEEIWEKVKTVGNNAISSQSDIDTAIKFIETIKPRFAGTEFDGKAAKAIATLKKAKDAAAKKREEAVAVINIWKKNISENPSEEEENIRKTYEESQVASGTEVKITPSGGNNTKSAYEALKSPEKGTLFNFGPGNYLKNSIASCEAENLILQGSPDSFLGELRISDSKKIIIRQIHCGNLTAFSDCVIIDSVIENLDVSGGSITISNCLIGNLSTPGGTPDIKIRNSTFAPIQRTKAQLPAIFCGPGANISIYGSIIYSADSEAVVFSNSSTGSFKLQNSILDAPRNIAAIKEFDFGNFRHIRDITSLSDSGIENVSVKNILLQSPGFASLLKKDYRLNADSPGKAALKDSLDAGVTLGKNGFPAGGKIE